MRLFHWLLVALVVFSFITGKLGGYWLEWHMRSGAAILALLVFRIAWGFVGTDTARFAQFLRGPATALAYVRARMAGTPHRALGHNPLGGWMVVAMLAILATQAFSGLFVDDEIATQGPLAVKVSNAFVARMSWLHHLNHWILLGAVVLHLVAVATYQWGFRTNLIGPMIHGGEGPADPARRTAPIALAVVLLAAAGAAVYYLVVVYPRSP